MATKGFPMGHASEPRSVPNPGKQVQWLAERILVRFDKRPVTGTPFFQRQSDSDIIARHIVVSTIGSTGINGDAGPGLANLDGSVGVQVQWLEFEKPVPGFPNGGG